MDETDIRERKRRLIYRIVDMFFDLDGKYDQCPPDEVDHEQRARLDDKVWHYLLFEEEDRDLKDEALEDMLGRIMERTPQPNLLTRQYLDFPEIVMGVRPDGESLRRYVRERDEVASDSTPAPMQKEKMFS